MKVLLALWIVGIQLLIVWLDMILIDGIKLSYVNILY